MADTLPLLKYDGAWVRPLVDEYRLGAPFGAVVSSMGNGLAFTRAGPEGHARSVTFAIQITGFDMAAWWWALYALDLMYGARRFGALLSIGGADRYCVCQCSRAINAGNFVVADFVLTFEVEVMAEFETEGELTGG